MKTNLASIGIDGIYLDKYDNIVTDANKVDCSKLNGIEVNKNLSTSFTLDDIKYHSLGLRNEDDCRIPNIIKETKDKVELILFDDYSSDTGFNINNLLKVIEAENLSNKGAYTLLSHLGCEVHYSDFDNMYLRFCCFRDTYELGSIRFNYNNKTYNIKLDADYVEDICSTMYYIVDGLLLKLGKSSINSYIFISNIRVSEVVYLYSCVVDLQTNKLYMHTYLDNLLVQEEFICDVDLDDLTIRGVIKHQDGLVLHVNDKYYRFGGNYAVLGNIDKTSLLK